MTVPSFGDSIPGIIVAVLSAGWSFTRQDTCHCHCSCTANVTTASPSLDASGTWLAFLLSWVWPLLGVTLACVVTLAQLTLWISRQCCSRNTVPAQEELGDPQKSEAAVAALARAQLDFLKSR